MILLWLAIGCFGSKCIRAQNTLGIPTIINYTKAAYNAGSQNWGLAQDSRGLIYAANNQGLLTFDGTFWRKYTLPNKTIVRSVAVDKNNRVYVGGQSEFGYFQANAKGELIYTSLMPFLTEKAKDFTDVWNICFFNNRVFFRAYRKIFEYDGARVIVHDGVHWSFLGTDGKHLFAVKYKEGLVTYSGGQWQSFIKQGQLPADVVIRSTLGLGNDSTLVVTLTHGLFILHQNIVTPFTSPAIQALSAQNIYGASLPDSNRIALVTNLSGCVIIDRKGAFVQRLTKKEGLQNNNILSVLCDRDKNLWFGLDNGIDLVQSSNAIQQLFPEPEDRNAGFSSVVYNNKLYLGLSTGAYVADLGNEKDISFTHGEFSFVKGSKGQVWNFSVIDNRLLLGHNTGAYIVQEAEAVPVDKGSGFWTFQPVKANEPYRVLTGTYTGLRYYSTKEQAGFDSAAAIRFESARFVVQHNNEVWIAHPFKGLYIVRYNAEGQPVVSVYPDKQKILSNNHNSLFSVGNRMVLISDNGIYEFDDNKQDFVHSDFLTKVLHTPNVSYLKQDQYGNIWFCKDKKLGIVDRTAGNRLIYFPELANKIQSDGFENINVVDSNNVLIAGEKGFFHLNYAAYKKNRYPLRVLISRVSIATQKDSLLYGGYAPVSASPAISYSFNSLHFETSTTLFGQENTVEYSYYLDGFDKGWSDWSKKTEKDYTNLPPGRYVFNVQCRNNFDNVSPVASYSFTILSPWYRTWWAYVFYALLTTAVLYFFYKRQQQKYRRQQQQRLAEQQRKYDEEQKQLQIQHRLEISESEKQIAQLQKEKLQAEVEHKNTELASSAMNLVHKAEILSKLKEDLLQLKETTPLEKGGKEFQKIIKLIDGELDHAQEWEQFAKHFDNVHNNYLQKLKERCPDLTGSELKLAAYLRLNLSTKEMAQLMNISVRGVETSRYRLRKKLGLTNEEANLYDYLIQITR